MGCTNLSKMPMSKFLSAPPGLTGNSISINVLQKLIKMHKFRPFQ